MTAKVLVALSGQQTVGSFVDAGTVFLPQATTPMYCFMLIRSRIKVKRYAVININKGFLMFISLLAISH